MTGDDSCEACAIACQNCAVYSVFPSGMTSHSKIALLTESVWALCVFEIALAFCLGFTRERIKRRFVTSNVSASNMMPASYALDGPVIKI